MFQFIGFVLKAPLDFAKKFIQSPISTLYYGLVGQWYLVTMSLCVVVLYWVIVGFNKAGVTDFAFKAFSNASREIKGFAQFCIPLVTNINAFIDCALHTPEYTGDGTSNIFERSMNNDLDGIIQHPINHDKMNLLSPYELLNDKEDQKSSPDQNAQ